MFIYPDRPGGLAARLVWGFALLGFGIATAIFIVGSCRAYNSKKWPITEGTVIAYYQNPEYHYSVGGVSYENSQVSSLEFVAGIDYRNGEINLRKYPLYGKVSVHYDPRNPRIAVLDTTFDPVYYAVSAILLAISVLCATGFLQGWPLRVRIGL